MAIISNAGVSGGLKCYKMDRAADAASDFARAIEHRSPGDFDMRIYNQLLKQTWARRGCLMQMG